MVPLNCPAVSQVTLAISWPCSQPMAELVESLTAEVRGSLLLQPSGKQSAAGGVIERAHFLAIEPRFPAQVLNGQFTEPSLRVSQLRDAFAEASNALLAAGMQVVQHRNHLVPDSVAFHC